MFQRVDNSQSIHKFECQGDVFVYDVNALSSFRVDALISEIMDAAGEPEPAHLAKQLGGRYSLGEIREGLEELRQLEQEGALFAAQRVPARVDAVPWFDLVLQIAHDCNLRCGYCFADHGRYGGSATRMSREIAERAVDLFMDTAPKTRGLSMSLFGGEPLTNVGVVKHVVSYARHRADRLGLDLRAITIVTNGTLLTDSIVKYLDESGLYLKVSLDGPADVHDRTRAFPDGRGSYKLTMDGLERVRDTGLSARTTLSATYCAESLALSRIFAHLLGTGFQSLELAPANLPPGHTLAIRDEDIPSLRVEYEATARMYLDALSRGMQCVVRSFETVLYRLACGVATSHLCRAGETTLTVAPDGRIFPCYELDGHDEWVVGDVFRGVQARQTEVWRRTQGCESNPTCRRCWARYLCGGNCRAHGLLFHGRLGDTVATECAVKQTLFETCIWLLSELRDNPPSGEALAFLKGE